LEPGDVITEGAVCDRHVIAPDVVVQPVEARIIPVPWDKPEPLRGTCMNCKYSFLDGTQPRCLFSNKEITPMGSCKKWDDFTETTEVVEPEIDIYNGDCSDCVHSMYKDNEPYCNLHNVGIVPEGYCDNYKREGSE
jgi:hypothetical protein